MQKQYKILNVVLGWVAFAIAAATYLLTIEPTASFWDCGEFISSAYKLDVGHAPGAPFFILMGHFASLFAKDPAHVAMCVNALSAIASAFTILFLFWTITALAKKLVIHENKMSVSQMIGVLGAGMVGALAYTFSDTFWFSAVEGEVYASSSLFTAIVFWLILKWDEHADEAGSDKWLVLIAYLMGLSIGVHLLNLLTIPAIALIYYYRRYKFSIKGLLITIVASAGILAMILYGIIPGTVQIACWAELLFVNKLHCPFNTGLAVYLCLLGVILIWAIVETTLAKSNARQLIAFILTIVLSGIPFLGGSWKIGIALILLALVPLICIFRNKLSSRMMNTATLMIAVIILGYSSYAVTVIRSSADTPMDQNSPDNVFNLKYYLNREQYGDRPLFYGQTYNTKIVDVKYGETQYVADLLSKETGKNKYIESGKKQKYVYEGKSCMLFPRMYSNAQHHIESYKSWGNVKGRYPTFGENIWFFLTYQCDWMYWRYFMWNFAGRQNDLQGHGDVMKGNWISGIPFLDNFRLGDQSLLPQELKENKGHNVYFMLPLLLGVFGIVYQLLKKKKGAQSFVVTFMLFFLTGLAIVIYLNQTPSQPRERDYAYAGSFYAFCVWVGLGVLGIVELLNKLLKKAQEPVKAVLAAFTFLICLGVPALMAQQNWDDHDRSKRYCCRDFGANYLNSIDKDAIIFCNGDNDTFPLWYCQEVEGIGADARACNLSYLQTDWYIEQMKRPYYDSPALPISWETKDYMAGKNEIVYVDNRLKSQPMSVEQAFKAICSNDKEFQRNGRSVFLTDTLYIPIDTAEVLNSPIFKDENGECYYKADNIDKRIKFFLGQGKTRSDIMVMDMINTAHWQRPIYYAMTVGNSSYLGLESYFEQTGLAYQITPVPTPNFKPGQNPRVNVEKMYDNIMHKFRYGNMNADGVYIDENTMRMCYTHRMAFASLARELARRGDNERAVEVLDYAEEVLPVKNIPYNYTSLSMAEIYYAVGETEKAHTILDAMAKNSCEYFTYEKSLPREYRRTVKQTVDYQYAMLQSVLSLAQDAQDEEILDTYYPIFVTYNKNRK